MKTKLSVGGIVLGTAIGSASAALSRSEEASACIAPLTYLPLDAAVVGADDKGTPALGTYERVSPDGRFVLRSYSGARLGKVSLMELPATAEGPVLARRTPFSNEAFPVQGTWRYLVDVNGEHYRFADVLRQQADAKPLFKGGMTGFYAAASELAGAPTEDAGAPLRAALASPKTIRIRSLSWPQGADSDAQGVGPMQVATIEVQDDGTRAEVRRTVGPRFVCGTRASSDGGVFALPMLSVDGMEFSAIPQVPRVGQPTMRVYAIGSSGSECTLQVDLGASPSKAVFGFASADGAPAWLAFSDLGSVYVFDRAVGRSFRLDHGRHRVLASAFPGLTRDGRVIYGATWHECADGCAERSGYVVVDPYQGTAYRAFWAARGQPAPRSCITQADVASERTRFAHLHGLPP